MGCKKFKKHWLKLIFAKHLHYKIFKKSDKKAIFTKKFNVFWKSLKEKNKATLSKGGKNKNGN